MINILLITNTTDVTTDFIVKDLRSRGIPFYRLNTDEIGISTQLYFDFANREFMLVDRVQRIELDLLLIRSVYFRRPELRMDLQGLTGAEANFIRGEMTFVLEGLYKILDKAYWLNKLYSIRHAENKIYQLLIAEEEGLVIPRSLVTNIPEIASGFYKATHRSTIIKPIKSGLLEAETEEGVIFTSKVDLTDENVQRVGSCPVYLQQMISKQGDVRVTVVGDKVFAACIHSQNHESSIVDWRKTEELLPHSSIVLPDELSKKCLNLTRRLSLNFGAIDFILDKNGEYIFLEINPNGQWAWIEKQLNYPISNAITNLLIEHCDH